MKVQAKHEFSHKGITYKANQEYEINVDIYNQIASDVIVIKDPLPFQRKKTK